MKKHRPLKPDKDGQAALIYCRVSDKKQRTDGHGLESQEHRCRQYADERGLEAEMVFTDDISGGGDFMKRPAMRALLAFLSSEPDEDYVVIFDDLKRFARDTRFHWDLREKLASFGASVECLNFKFDDTPEGRFVETMFAASGQLEREQNGRQVVQKMTARVERGYWVFHPSVGYRYEKDKVHGKILARDEPVASIIAEALEGFASGRFASQYEVKRFLEAQPDFPKSGASGYVHPSKVKDMLQRVVYAGYVEAPMWGVSLRKGHHDPLISLATFERTQSALSGKVYAPARKDISEDFPLRGFVCCDDCGEPMTSCWSKGRNKHYAYYLCDTPTCPSRRKSIPRAKIEDGAEAMLRSLQPVKQVLALAKVKFRDAWEIRHTRARAEHNALQAQVSELDKQIDTVLDKIVETSSPKVMKALEERIESLERQKLRLAKRTAEGIPPEGRADEFIEPLLEFLSRPWNIYNKGNIALKRTVLKLVFADPLRYSRENGYRTAETTFPSRC